MKATPAEAAHGMLHRYSTPKIALEMARFHSFDYEVGSEHYRYWQEVAMEIRKQANLDAAGNRLNPIDSPAARATLIVGAVAALGLGIYMITQSMKPKESSTAPAPTNPSENYGYIPGSHWGNDPIVGNVLYEPIGPIGIIETKLA